MRKGGLLNGCKTLQNRTKKLIRQGNGLGATPPYHYLYHIICITGDDVRNIIQHHLWYGNNRIRSNEKLHEQQFIMVTGKGILYNVIFFFIQSKKITISLFLTLKYALTFITYNLKVIYYDKMLI